MKQAELATHHIIKEIAEKNILEIACGCAEFSIAASQKAEHVTCIDLESFRLSPMIEKCSNVTFLEMNAAHTVFPDATYDCIVAYNAIGHLQDVLGEIIIECQRLLKPEGHLYFISSWKMDQKVIETFLIPLLNASKIEYMIEEDKTFTYLRIGK